MPGSDTALYLFSLGHVYYNINVRVALSDLTKAGKQPGTVRLGTLPMDTALALARTLEKRMEGTEVAQSGLRTATRHPRSGPRLAGGRALVKLTPAAVNTSRDRSAEVTFRGLGHVLEISLHRTRALHNGREVELAIAPFSDGRRARGQRYPAVYLAAEDARRFLGR